MTVLRTFQCKVKPGRMQDAVTQVATLKRLSMAAGATAFGALNVLTGPLYPGLTVHIGSEDLAAFGRVRDTVLANPDAAQFFADEAPVTIVNAILAEPVYRAGPPIVDIYERMTVRINTVYTPHTGREADLVRRLSRFADAAHACGALMAVVRRAIAGTEGPRLAVFGYFTDWDHLARSRAALQESELWLALSRSQDAVATHLGVTISTKLAV